MSEDKKLVKTIWCMTKSHPMFDQLVQGWKDNMSTAGSKLITARIEWTEQKGLLPLLILGMKGNRVRYAAHGGSEDIHYDADTMFVASESLYQLDAANNDDVNAWRNSIGTVVVATKKDAAPTKKETTKAPAEYAIDWSLLDMSATTALPMPEAWLGR
ncbi:hypothetical protein FJ366_04370 [Candidatus Dependentiae bacterium]|nr:hypothetical protein [Candidatus Dependentiae bacterium]